MSEIVMIPVDRLHVDGNPREQFDAKDIEGLAASIAANGILDPLRITPNADGYRIESGQRRHAAATLAGLTEVPCLIVEHEDRGKELVAAVVTNVQREQLNPVDEAKAYLTLQYEHGLTTDGIAEKVGVPRSRVTQRLDLLELPEAVVELFRQERIPPSCRLSLRAMQSVSAELCREVAKACAGKDEWCAVLAKEPMRVALHMVNEKPKRFFAIPQAVDADRVKLSKEAKEYAEANSNEYRRWMPRFETEDVDAALAAGIAYRGKGADEKLVVVCDPEWVADRVDAIVDREVTRRAERAAEAARYEAGQGAIETGTPSEEAAKREKELRAAEREARAEGKKLARNHNEELGIALLNSLATIPCELTLDQAKAVGYALVGTDFGQAVRSGLAVCLPEFFTIEQHPKKGEVVTYETSVQANETKGWEWLHRAKTPGEFLGRCYIIALAAMYADQGVHPQSSEGKGEGSLPRTLHGSQNKDLQLPNQVTASLEAVAKKVLPKKLVRRGRQAWPSSKPLDALRTALADAAQGK